MQKLLFILVTTGELAVRVHAQQILLDNSVNYNPSTAATSSGLVWLYNGSTYSLFDGFNFDLGITVLAGPTQSSLSDLGTYYPGDSYGTVSTGIDMGRFLQLPSLILNIPGVVNAGSAWVKLEAWTFNSPGSDGATTYAAAISGGHDYVGTVLFQNPTGGNTNPPLPAQELTGMLAFILYIPEPSTFALAGLGLTSLWILRRHK